MTATTNCWRAFARPCLTPVVLIASSLAALAWAAFGKPAVQVVYNPSDSVPVGWYRIGPPHRLRAGDIVLTRLPVGVAVLAARRHYLPGHIPLLKRVGAVAPQHVCIAGGLVRIDGAAQGAVLRADRLGRALPVWTQCRRLVDGELFLLSITQPASFDSRYFGPVAVADVIGVAQPIRLETPR